MGRESLRTQKSRFHEESMDEALSKPFKAGVTLGDVTWVKLRGSSWWPAQVVDEKAVSDTLKPRKGKSGEVLVRLYGTYKYSYVNPSTTKSEFDDVLKRHKGGHMEIIQKALKQDFCESESGRSKKQSSKEKGQTKIENGSVVKEKAGVKRATDEQDGEKNINSPSSDATPRSIRRLRVMQDLGLTAPSGSPFLKNEHVSSIMESVRSCD